MKILSSSFLFSKSPFLAKSELNVQCSYLRKYCNFAIGKTFLLPPFDITFEESLSFDLRFIYLMERRVCPMQRYPHFLTT